MEEKITKKMCILDINYSVENEKPVISIFGKTEDGKSVIVFDRGFVPYFYVEPKDLNRTDLNTLPALNTGGEILLLAECSRWTQSRCRVSKDRIETN